MPYHLEEVNETFYPTRAAYHFFGCQACMASLGWQCQPLLYIRGMMCPGQRAGVTFERLKEFVNRHPEIHNDCYREAEPKAPSSHSLIATAIAETAPDPL